MRKLIAALLVLAAGATAAAARPITVQEIVGPWCLVATHGRDMVTGEYIRAFVYDRATDCEPKDRLVMDRRSKQWLKDKMISLTDDGTQLIIEAGWPKPPSR